MNYIHPIFYKLSLWKNTVYIMSTTMHTSRPRAKSWVWSVVIKFSKSPLVQPSQIQHDPKRPIWFKTSNTYFSVRLKKWMTLGLSFSGKSNTDSLGIEMLFNNISREKFAFYFRNLCSVNKNQSPLPRWLTWTLQMNIALELFAVNKIPKWSTWRS